MRSRLPGPLLALLLLGGQAHAADKPLRLVSVDVEGGAATLFVTPEGRSLLVDTGWPDGTGGPPPAAGAAPALRPSSADRIAAAARKLGVRKLDYVLVTHYHPDHVGGVKDLLRLLPVGVFLDHGPNRETAPSGQQGAAPSATHSVNLYREYDALAAGRRRTVKAGDRIVIGSMTLDFVNADGQVRPRRGRGAGKANALCDATPDRAPDLGENARSIGFVASYGRARILNTSDTTWNVEKALVCPTDRLGRMDVLVVPHHGSAQSSTPALIGAAAATVAVMQNGPRKGGDKAVLEAFSRYSPATVVWQQHAATRSPEADRPADYIANLAAAPDAGHAIEVEVFRNGRLRVTNARNGYQQTYPARRSAPAA